MNRRSLLCGFFALPVVAVLAPLLPKAATEAEEVWKLGYGVPLVTSGTEVLDFSPVLLANLRLEESSLFSLPVGEFASYWQEDALTIQTVDE